MRAALRELHLHSDIRLDKNVTSPAACCRAVKPIIVGTARASLYAQLDFEFAARGANSISGKVGFFAF